jgi:hypothetical protein
MARQASTGCPARRSALVRGESQKGRARSRMHPAGSGGETLVYALIAETSKAPPPFGRRGKKMGPRRSTARPRDTEGWLYRASMASAYFRRSSCV